MDANDSRGYRPIASYGLIGDMFSAALVARDGGIDWCCWPRFDSPAIFHRLLDADRGGFFGITPTETFETERSYIEGTNVLQTNLSTASGAIRLTDFMPVDDSERSDETSDGRILRRIEGLSGEVEVQIRVRPTFDWGRASPRFVRHDWGVKARSDDAAVALVGAGDFKISTGDTLTTRLDISDGDEIWLGLQYLPDPEAAPSLLDAASAQSALDDTVSYWRDWLDRCTYDGRYAELVDRSALTLKLLTYRPSGAVIAAPTTSLPEHLGGVRNWDYRYVWLRDAGLILRSLQALDYHDEAMTFWGWLEDLCLGDLNEIQNIYTVDGETDLPEQTLDHLEGYQNSRPVRVGNAAAGQLQLDLFGHVVEAAQICQTRMREPHPKLKPALRFLTQQAAERWSEPDHGIWELRSEPRHHVHSKLRCWVALDRALDLAERDWLDGDTECWRNNRRELRETIEQRGYNDELGAFTQTLDGDALDAGALMIPLVGFLPPDDPRVQSTIDCVQDQLMADGLVKRYRTSDGLPGAEGTFVMCSFWLVSALAESGRQREARELFDYITSHTNDLDLLSEEVAPREDQLLGNFPQGFSHLALIDAALRLDSSSSTTPE